MAQNPTRRYKSTESKYKGGAKEMYVTYDLKQKTRGNGPALYHKIKRVYIAGDVTNWESGEVQKRSGRQVSGVLIDYKQTRAGHQRKEYTAQRAKTTYKVKPATVKGSSQRFRQVVEIPEDPQNVHFSTRARKNYPENIKVLCKTRVRIRKSRWKVTASLTLYRAEASSTIRYF